MPWPQALRGPGGWLLAALLLAVLLLTAVRRPLAALIWPESRIQLLLDEGEHALAQGRLDVADGSGARQKFEAAQALDTDRTEARDGLTRVGLAALDEASRQIEAGEHDRARLQLQLAAALQVPRVRIDALEQRLRALDTARIDPADALRRADAALATGNPDAALPLYAEVLAVEPRSIAALEGREDALSLLLERVRIALDVGRLDDAARWLQAVRRQDPGHVGLPAAQAGFAQALEAELTAASRDQVRGRAGSAARRYLQLAPVAAELPAWQQGAARAASALAADAVGQVRAGRLDDAAQALQLAAALAPASAAVRDASATLERARLATPGDVVAPLDATQQRALQAALAGFDAAVAREAWAQPEGDNAAAHLRAAQAIAADAPGVIDAAARLAPAARACQEAALRDNRLRQSEACLAAWQLAAPTDPALLPARLRVAQRWLAIGEERLRAGEVDVAVRTLDAARALDPQAAGLDDFAAQIARARSGLR